jgi:hypothetical protein
MSNALAHVDPSANPRLPEIPPQELQSFKTSIWDEDAPTVELPKAWITALGIAGLASDETVSPEAVALCELTPLESEAVATLYATMKEKFAELEKAHFGRLGSNNGAFVLRAFPEKSAALQQEWNQSLRAMLGDARGDLLDQLIRTRMSPMTREEVLSSIRARLATRTGNRFEMPDTPGWLHRGLHETYVSLEQKEGATAIYVHCPSSSEDENRSFVPGRIPKRWRHLLTPDTLSGK